ncbi:putative DNA modification methylase [Caldisphaera lagunensis DSM 15908]|uniref:Putative DNA modification methylase n=1 Tax=Caldisphaera lagunensis (strain DSM 15908 / JCM 11604 / ANMR 0165 / IC-154) TaxID=1056495 RepID=L0ADG3_CALLD|nr:putative DNA modification methylase [Caldisphaera lagunensis DSM 15908]
MFALQKYYALLSGLHPTLPKAELESLIEVTNSKAKIIYNFDGVSIIEGFLDANNIVKRSGYIKEMGYLLGIYEDIDYNDIVKKLKDYGIKEAKVKGFRYKGFSHHINIPNVEISLSRELDKNGINANPRSNTIVRIIITEGIIIAGLLISIQENSYKERIRNRPFKRPGQIDQQLSRVMVNLSRLKDNYVFLDPFCGTGSLALEACSLNASLSICMDLDINMVKGSMLNMKSYDCCKSYLIVRHNVVKMPLKDESIDSLSTDPPYGRSTSTNKKGYKILTKNFLEEGLRVLKKGSYVVYAGPSYERPYIIAKDLGYEMIGTYDMFVHNSLNRQIVVVRKT